MNLASNSDLTYYALKNKLIAKFLPLIEVFCLLAGVTAREPGRAPVEHTCRLQRPMLGGSGLESAKGHAREIVLALR